MALTDKTLSLIAFKNLLGKSHTDNNKGLGNEAEGIFLNIASGEVLLDEINSDPSIAVSQDIAVFVEADLVEDTTSNGHAYFAQWPNPLPSGAPSGVSPGDRVRVAIPPSFGFQYEAKPKDINSNSIPVNDPRDWIYQYNSGVFFQQDVVGDEPGTIELYVYKGETLNNISTDTSNGIEELEGGTIGLGGSLIKNTTIDGSNFNFSILNLDNLELDTSNFNINLSNSAIFTDSSTSGFGLQYASNYSSNYTNRSLVDKEYVDTEISSNIASISADNGLQELTSGTIGLGGTLTQNTTISGDTGTYNLTINEIGVLNLATNSGYDLTMNGSAIFTDTANSKGLEYGANYGTNFTNRSLVDKEYVDTEIANNTTTIYANNGLNLDNSTIGLGGTLIENTTISGDIGSYNLTINEIGVLNLATNSGYDLTLDGLSATFTDNNNNSGLAYAADYSTNYTNRSLVDKEYVDTEITNNTAFATISDKNQQASATSSDGDTTGVSIASTPSSDSYVEVLVNGAQQILGDGVKTNDCYFSSDSGTTAKNIANIESGDTLYWNGSIAGFELETTDIIDFNYEV